MTESAGQQGLSAEAAAVLAVLERNRRTFAWKTGGLDAPAQFTRLDGRPATVREMLLDMIEEYARHTGHADLLRESVDGLTGEGAPADFRF
jgi:hypothetical protein